MISKLYIIDRKNRVVKYTNAGGRRVTLWLKQEPRCNAGDVQRAFNLQVRQGNYAGAIDILKHKVDHFTIT